MDARTLKAAIGSRAAAPAAGRRLRQTALAASLVTTALD